MSLNLFSCRLLGLKDLKCETEFGIQDNDISEFKAMNAWNIDLNDQSISAFIVLVTLVNTVILTKGI